MWTLLKNFGPVLLLLSFAAMLIRFPQEFTKRDLKEKANHQWGLRLKRIGWGTVVIGVVVVIVLMVLRIAH